MEALAWGGCVGPRGAAWGRRCLAAVEEVRERCQYVRVHHFCRDPAAGSVHRVILYSSWLLSHLGLSRLLGGLPYTRIRFDTYNE